MPGFSSDPVPSFTGASLTDRTRPTAPPRPIEVRTDDVFLTPRVIDQSAFEDLAARLREIITEAANSAREASQWTQKLAEAHTEFTAAEEKHRSQIALGARLMRAVTEKADEARGLVDRADQQAAAIQASQSEMERDGLRLAESRRAAMEDAARLIEERLAAATALCERRIGDAARAAQEHVVAMLDQRLSAASAVIEQQRAALTDACATADNQGRELRHTLASAEVLLRGEQASAGGEHAEPTGLLSLITRLDTAAAGARAARHEAEAAMLRLEASREQAGNAAAASAAACAELEARHAGLRENVEQSATRLREVETSIEGRLEAARVASAPLESLSQHCDKTAGRLRQSLGEIEAVTAQATQRGAEIRAAIVQLGQAAARLEPWRPMLLDAQSRPDGLPEPVQKLLDECRTYIAGDLKQMAQAMSMIAGRVDRMGRIATPATLVKPAAALAPQATPTTPT